ncbi:Rho guanyl nucleotide exchange factor [Colletotrichum tofieldiae]|uniref:Rho guanyl nucleotide exchange factor n=1 Tax=Colletotrichum tofieldiae TaxID=708197 RepID=A0A161V519_9PEZI|nr:Rho guanyl nucleotide exchange factor [Colletotrichum tofieldiae]
MESGSPDEEDRLASALSVQRQYHLQQHQPQQPLASPPQYAHQLHRQPNFDSNYDYHEADFELDSDPAPYRRRSDSSSHQSHRHYLPSSPVTNAVARENLDASAAQTAGAFAAAGHAHGSVNPDDFYRSYRGVQSTSHHHRTPSSDTDYMATSVSRARDNSAMRPNGNGKDPKHPPAPAGRTALRPSQRSASAPIEPPVGAPRTNTNRKPSVKDLTKRFDQQTSAPAMPRIPWERVNIILYTENLGES